MKISPFSWLTEPSYAAMRIVVGLLFMMNGAQKMFGMFGGTAVPFDLTTRIAWAGLIEFGGGLLIMIGLLTWLAAFISSGEMAFAYFMVHYPQGGWPINNGGQLSVFFCFVFLFIAARGGGIVSLDQVVFKKGK